jgi:hypothetical protein
MTEINDPSLRSRWCCKAVDGGGSLFCSDHAGFGGTVFTGDFRCSVP